MLQSLLTSMASRHAFTCRQNIQIHILRFHNINEETRRTEKKKKMPLRLCIHAHDRIQRKKIKLKMSDIHVEHGTGMILFLCTEVQQPHSVGSHLTVLYCLVVSQHLWATWFIFYVCCYIMSCYPLYGPPHTFFHFYLALALQCSVCTNKFIKKNDWKYVWLFFFPAKILAVGSTESKGSINVAAITRIKKVFKKI